MELLQVDVCSENSPSIALYADGSFCQEVGVGAWAFRIPAMNLEDAGSSEGHTTTRFEFLGVLHGLESLAATDTSGCPVHVFSDCESTVAAIIGSSSRPTRCLSPSAPQDQGTVAGSGCFACADNSPSALRKVYPSHAVDRTRVQIRRGKRRLHRSGRDRRDRARRSPISSPEPASVNRMRPWLPFQPRFLPRHVDER